MQEPCPLANPQFEFELQLIEVAHQKMRSLVEGVSREQLFAIPKGFHNNILWNYGHALVAQQVLCYQMSGLPLRIPSYAPSFFGKGTKPSDWTASVDPAEVIGWDEDALRLLREDLHNHVFKTYKTYTSSMGVTLTNISEALAYAAWHDSLHLGVMISQRKLV